MQGSGFAWEDGRRAAISLAYEPCGALAPDAIRLLDSHELRATFFIAPTDLLENPVGWRTAVDAGHEIGDGSLLGMTDDGRLPNWTRRMIEDDLLMAEELFAEWAPAPNGRVGSYPGRYLECADGDYADILEAHYPFVRSAQRGVNHPVFCKPKALMHLPVSDALASDTMANLESAVELGAWTILSFDLKSSGVADLHAALLDTLPGAFENVLWAPMGEVAGLISSFHARLTLR